MVLIKDLKDLETLVVLGRFLLEVQIGWEFTLGGGYISVNNKGVQSQLRLYCEVNNVMYGKVSSHKIFGNVTITLPPTTDTRGKEQPPIPN